jgi:hypothetical protein
MFRVAFLFMVMCIFVACKGVVGDSDVKYSVMPYAEKTSLLVDIDQTNEIHICVKERVPTFVKALGISQRDIEGRLFEVSDYAQSAVRTWLSFLNENKFWRRKDPKIHVYMGSAECASMPSSGVEIETDVGPARNASGNEPDCGFYFKEPDGRVCRAHAIPAQRKVRIASAGWHGANSTIAHEFGHIFGLGDVYDAPNYQEGFAKKNEASLMGGSPAFHVDDYLGINGVWSYIKFGVACRQGMPMNPEVKSIFGSLHCATERNRAPQRNSKGDLACEPGFWLSPLQVCIAGVAGATPTCPAHLPQFDYSVGVCCPDSQFFNPAIMACSHRPQISVVP